MSNRNNIQRTSNQPTHVADLKLVLLGESAVGKSSLAQRFTTNTFDDNKESTIGAAFVTKKIYLEQQGTVPDGGHIQDDEDRKTLKLINFQIWDTAGQERYKSLTPMYYRNANIAIVVFDVTDPSSFEKAENWVNELRATNGYDLQNLKIFLVGNKFDLLTDDSAELLDFKSSFSDQEIIYTSAKNGKNVDQLFESIISNVDDSMFVKVDENGVSMDNRLNKKKSSIIDLTEFNNKVGDSCSC